MGPAIDETPIAIVLKYYVRKSILLIIGKYYIYSNKSEDAVFSIT